MSDATTDFDVVVVGAGPAGSAAAITAARRGARVCLLERGPFPGSKNLYGGVVYGRILDTLVPEWWNEMPVQRWVTRRGTVLMTDTQSLTIDYRTDAWGTAPYNGATTLRPDFDSWLAEHAVAAGATLVTATTATGLLRDDGGRIRGVRTDRPDGDLTADVVIACDGANSFLAREAGLYPNFSADHFTLGAKEVLHLPKEEIDRRFGLVDRQGADFEIVGCTGDVPGGGFVYTNLDTISVGVVLGVTGLAAGRTRPEEFIARLKAHPMVAPWVDGAELKEYGAHLIPEAGFDAMPELSTDGFLVAGDAASMCLAAGIWLEGVNYAIGAGAAAGETAADAVRRGDTTKVGLAGYHDRLEQGFVLKNLRKLRGAPHLVLSDRVQQRYPQLACDLAEAVFTVTDPSPKPRLTTTARRLLGSHGVRLRDLVRDARAGWKAYG